MDGGGTGQRFGDGFAGHFVSEPEVRSVAGLAGPMAAAIRLATSAGGVRNRTRAQIAELGNLLRDLLASLFEIGKGKGQVGPPVPSVSNTQGKRKRKKNPAFPHFCVAHPYPFDI